MITTLPPPDQVRTDLLRPLLHTSWRFYVLLLLLGAVVKKEMLSPPATTNLIFGSMLSFLGILFVGYLYALKKHAFDWKN